MADINTVTIIGRLTRDAELKFTPNGQAVNEEQMKKDINELYNAILLLVKAVRSDISPCDICIGCDKKLSHWGTCKAFVFVGLNVKSV